MTPHGGDVNPAGAMGDVTCGDAQHGGDVQHEQRDGQHGATVAPLEGVVVQPSVVPQKRTGSGSSHVRGTQLLLFKERRRDGNSGDGNYRVRYDAQGTRLFEGGWRG